MVKKIAFYMPKHLPASDVFGCAGIKGITSEISEVRSLGLYMYGEICMTERGA